MDSEIRMALYTLALHKAYDALELCEYIMSEKLTTMASLRDAVLESTLTESVDDMSSTDLLESLMSAEQYAKFH